eukprot:1160234-Pelagomonas_calceolata.AAC.5
MLTTAQCWCAMRVLTAGAAVASNNIKLQHQAATVSSSEKQQACLKAGWLSRQPYLLIFPPLLNRSILF